MSYIHLTIEERCCIREYYKNGKSFREIARLIGRSASTISRDIKRNRTYLHDKTSYYPHTAQKKYLLRRLKLTIVSFFVEFNTIFKDFL